MFPEVERVLGAVEAALLAAGSPPPPREAPTLFFLGARGAGKSSLLQRLAGWTFLPPGVATLRPLRVLLRGGDARSVRLETDRSWIEEPGAAALLTEMRRPSSAPVRLHVTAPGASAVTLVELPPEVAAAALRDRGGGGGDYLLLAVTSAAPGDAPNDDRVWAAAQEADPRGVRTLGVVTKLDLVGADAPLPTPPFLKATVGVVCGGGEDDDRAELRFSRWRCGAAPWPVGAALLRRAAGRRLQAWAMDRLREREEALRGRLSVAEREAAALSVECGHGLVFRLVGRLRAAFRGELQGSPGAGGRLSCGALIADVFRDRLPADVAEVTAVRDPEAALREAAVALRNARGVRGGVFASDRALDAVVSSRLRGLTAPLLRCLGAVGARLLEAAERSCEEAAGGFPALRLGAARAIAAEVRRLEAACGAELRRYVQREMSYTNTRHEDLAAPLAPLRRGRLRGGWFVLTADALARYRDASESAASLAARVSLDEVALCRGRRGREKVVELARPDGRRLLLECGDEREAAAWALALRGAGVAWEGAAPSPLRGQAALVAQLAAAYAGVVARTAADQAPKIVVHGLVGAALAFVDGGLLAALGDAPHLLVAEEAAGRAARRRALRAELAALRGAVEAVRGAQGASVDL